MLFRLLVTFAFVARLLTGCCAGGCPLASACVLAGESDASVCDACGHTGCDGHCQCHHMHCCQPFCEDAPLPQEEAPAEPCGCPGHSHHFCLGTHLFAVGAERSELPTQDVQCVAVSQVEPALMLSLDSRRVAPAWAIPLDAASAQEMRAVLQVYVL